MSPKSPNLAYFTLKLGRLIMLLQKSGEITLTTQRPTCNHTQFNKLIVFQVLQGDSDGNRWSLGCLLYEMATNDPPFKAEDLRNLYKEIQKAEYPDIPGHYSSELMEVIRLLLQKNPRNRVDASNSHFPGT